MKHSEFKIGETFWCGGRQWRCTDIGTRVVVAIQIDSVESVRSDFGGTQVHRTLTGAEAEREGWFNGPPYDVAEGVFDEYDIPACSFGQEGHGMDDGTAVTSGISIDQARELRQTCRALRASVESAEGASSESAPAPCVYLLHGKGGSPGRTVKQLQERLEEHWSDVEFVSPKLPHCDPEVAAEVSVEFLKRMELPHSSLVIGVSLGGLVAARLQELGREDLHVVAISSPTWADGVKLERLAVRRVALYSSFDTVIAGRVDNWPHLASFSRDFPWLTHDTDRHLEWLASLIRAYRRR